MTTHIPESTPEQKRLWEAYQKVQRIGADTKVLNCPKCGGYPHEDMAGVVVMYLMMYDRVGPLSYHCSRCGKRMPWMERRSYDEKVRHNKRHENLDWNLKNERRPLWQIL